jgi:hypothetical protein
LKVIRALVGRATFLDDDDVQVSIKTAGFPKQMDSEERAGRPTADDGDAIAVLEAH